MTGRAWVLVVGVGLCVSLAPGCAHTNGHTVEELNHGADDPGRVLSAPPGSLPTGRDRLAGSTPPTSPYHLLPRLQEKGDPIWPIAQTDYPVSPSVPNLPLAAAPAGELEAPPKENRLSSEQPAPARMPDSSGASTALADLRVKPVAEAPLMAALRYCLEKRPAEALSSLERYDRPNQDLLLCLLPLASRLAESSLTQASPQEVSVILAQLNQVLVPLRPRATLTISKMCFCRSIEKFGSYEPFPPQHEFRPNLLVQVYVELQNFTSEGHGPLYKTRLASSVHIRDEHNQIVWRQDFPEGTQPDLSRTPRQDYFLNCSFRVPQLPPGPYTLSIQVCDVPTHRTTERVLDFGVAPG